MTAQLDRQALPRRGSRTPLAEGYRRCARLTWQHGTTYYWGAAMLPRRARWHVYAIYALCRMADDIVDEAGPEARPDRIRSELQAFADRFEAALDASESGLPLEEGGQGDWPDPYTLAAITHSVRTLGLPREYFDRFFGAMISDLVITRYDTWVDLVEYMEGSAAVIGEMMVPVLQPTSGEALEPARQLGFAFQLTNFLRDIAEDLDRGRVYLPDEDLRRFDVDLPAIVAAGKVTPQWRNLMAFEIERNREIYRRADEGLRYLPRDSRRCVATARVLYSEILARIEAADYDVFSERVRVSNRRKLGLALTARVGRTPSPTS